jgi:hypothetical protein
MSIFSTLGRFVAFTTVQQLCTRKGTALVVLGTLALAGSASAYLAQPATQVAPAAQATVAPSLRDVDGIPLANGQSLSLHDACTQPGYGHMLLCPLWH